MDQLYGKYRFGDTITGILDDQNHPFHDRYADALRSIQWPCTHGRVMLRNNPNEVFTNEMTRLMREGMLGWKIPIIDPPCSDFTDKYELFAYLGSGASGTAFAARSRDRAGDGTSINVAVKFMPIKAAWKLSPTIIEHPEFGLVFNEALAMALFRDHPGVPALHAVYAHGCTLIIVMELCGVWPNKADLDSLEPMDFDYWDDLDEFVLLKSCDGIELTTPHRYIHEYRKPGEIDVCKMASLHLNTLQLMKDRGCSHTDIALRNIVIGEHYNAKIIDWGAAQIHPSEEKWYDNSFFTKYEPEIVPPEWVRSGRQGFNRRKGRIIDDHRRIDLWRLSCLIYQQLHLAYPCDPLMPQKKRELRLRHGEISVRDDLSQDCIDAIHAMLEQNPQSRGRIEELATLPWLGGFHLDTDHTYENLLSRPFCPRPYSHGEFYPEGPPIRFQNTSLVFYGDRIASDKNSLYRCFAEWRYEDQNRWQEIKTQVLQYYMAYMRGTVYSRNQSEDAEKETIYRKIESETPRGVMRHLQTNNEHCPNIDIIRIIVDALQCQAVLISTRISNDNVPQFRVYGNIHEKRAPECFQIHLHFDYVSRLFELVMMHDQGHRFGFHGHRVDARRHNFELDRDHEMLLSRTRRDREAQNDLATILTVSGYDNYLRSSGDLAQ